MVLQPHLGEENLRPASGGASLRSHREAIREPGALGRQEKRRGEWAGAGTLQLKVWAIRPHHVSQERTCCGLSETGHNSHLVLSEQVRRSYRGCRMATVTWLILKRAGACPGSCTHAPGPNPSTYPPLLLTPLLCPLQPSRSLPWGMEFFLADSNRAPFYTPISDWIIHADRGLAAKDTVQGSLQHLGTSSGRARRSP